MDNYEKERLLEIFDKLFVNMELKIIVRDTGDYSLTMSNVYIYDKDIITDLITFVKNKKDEKAKEWRESRENQK